MKYDIRKDDPSQDALPESSGDVAPTPEASSDDSHAPRPITAGNLTEEEVIELVNERLDRDIPEADIVRELRGSRQSFRSTLLLVRRVSAANLAADYEPELLRFVSERQDKGEADFDIGKELIEQGLSADQSFRLLRDVAVMRAEIAAGRADTRLGLFLILVGSLMCFLHLCIGAVIMICLFAFGVSRHRLGTERMREARALLYPRIPKAG